MPSYGSLTPRAIYPGNNIALVNNAATDTGVTKTISVAFAKVPGYPATCSVDNTTAQTATVQTSFDDVDGDYTALKNGDTGLAITVAAASSVVFTCAEPWIRCTIATAPTTGSLVLSR